MAFGFIGEEERCWSDLPSEPLCLIRSHLMGADLIRFRSVCKAWSSVSPPIPSHLSLATDPHLFQHPWLLRVTNSTCNFSSPFANISYNAIIPDLENANIRFASKGWLLITRINEPTIFFFNPFTYKRIDLPPLPEHDHYYDQISFSFPPTSQPCIVVAMTKLVTEEHDHVIYTCITYGQTTWKVYDNSSFFCRGVPCFSNPAIFWDRNPHNGTGKFCCLIQQDGRKLLSVFCPRTQNVRNLCIFLPYSDSVFCRRPWEGYLIPSGRYLFLVVVLKEKGPDGECIRLFKLSSWSCARFTRVKDLGDETMLLFSRRASMSATVSSSCLTSEMGNKVYFLRGEGGVFFSPATRRLHRFDTGDSNNEQGLSGSADHVWILPNFKDAEENAGKPCSFRGREYFKDEEEQTFHQRFRLVRFR